MADKIRIDSKFDMRGSYEHSDSEDEYSPKEKQILEKVSKRKHKVSDSEDEIYAFSESDNDTSNKDFTLADSDVEGQEESEDDLPDAKAWGKNKKSYYATDFVDEDYGGFGNDEQAALLEEEEAKTIQKRLLGQLSEEDFTLEFFSEKTTDDKNEKETALIKSDWSQMSKRQKLQLLEKESPEFAGLVDDFKTKLSVAKDDLHPLLELVKDGKLPACSASKFVKTNYDLILNYCTNISYYLLLKSQKINIQNHPVIKRLYQYRQMLNKIEPIYFEVIKPQIDKILQAVSNNLELQLSDSPKDNKLIKKRKSSKSNIEPAPKKLKFNNSLDDDSDSDTGVSDNEIDYFKSDNETDNLPKVNDESEESGFSDNDEDVIQQESFKNKPSISSVIDPQDIEDKREITYQMAKNKGLTPHRKKDQRNPRVKHKLKYRKAKIRRKGAVREVRTEVTRYGGEASGIKANVKKSVKIK